MPISTVFLGLVLTVLVDPSLQLTLTLVTPSYTPKPKCTTSTYDTPVVVPGAPTLLVIVIFPSLLIIITLTVACSEDALPVGADPTRINNQARCLKLFVPR